MRDASSCNKKIYIREKDMQGSRQCCDYLSMQQMIIIQVLFAIRFFKEDKNILNVYSNN